MSMTIIQLALYSRGAIIFLQFLSNILINDHDAGVFMSPEDPMKVKTFDWIIELLFGGFRRWDAHYFLHIAEYGYTYENTLAFFPLFPLLVKLVVLPLSYIIDFLSIRSLSLLVAVILNIIFFIKATERLYELSEFVLKSKKKAKMSVIFFCFNPASIFFTAPYSEGLFAWKTFEFMCYCCKNITFKSSIPLSCSILCRSNGLLNIGFLIYFSIKNILMEFSYRLKLKIFLKTFLIIVFVLLNFLLLQIYHKYLFCNEHQIDFPSVILDHALNNSFILAGRSNSNILSPWCNNKLPMAYSYVQNHYWNVGFLNYYQLKQIPNFLLAFPIIFLLTKNSFSYLLKNKNYFLKQIGLMNAHRNNENKENKTLVTIQDKNIFPFVIHSLVLIIFSLFFVHIQVATRMLCSSSPLLYWFVTDYFHFNDDDDVSGGGGDGDGSTTLEKTCNEKSVNTDTINNNFNECDKDFKDFRLICKTKNIKKVSGLIIWFLTYSFVGTIMFSNFLPWT